MTLSLSSVQRQAVWEADLKAVRGGTSIGHTGLPLGDSLFSKELESMGKQLAGKQLYVCGRGSGHSCTCLTLKINFEPLVFLNQADLAKKRVLFLWGFFFHFSYSNKIDILSCSRKKRHKHMSIL